MSTWVTIPSARPVEQVEAWAKPWRERGYKIALWRDAGADVACDILRYGKYPGYAHAVNALILNLLVIDPLAEWFVIGGDDTQPDMNHSAEEIAEQCVRHFSDPEHESMYDAHAATFGVMQPTGDRYGENPNHPRPDMRGAYIDRIAGSAWIGREFARRVNGGNGPLWPQYEHMWVDSELREVAMKLGVYWERRDLIHYHDHAARRHGYSHDIDCPPHLRKWSIGEEGRKHWKESEALFFSRRDAGFPGHEPTRSWGVVAASRRAN